MYTLCIKIPHLRARTLHMLSKKASNVSETLILKKYVEKEVRVAASEFYCKWMQPVA
jgi:hypothetical protein